MQQAFGVGVEAGPGGQARAGFADGSRVTHDFIANFCRSLKLNLSQQLAFAVGLAQSPNPLVAQVRTTTTPHCRPQPWSCSPDFSADADRVGAVRAQEAYRYLKSKLQDLASSSSGGSRLGGEDGLHVLHSLLCVLRSNEVRQAGSSSVMGPGSGG